MDASQAISALYNSITGATINVESTQTSKVASPLVKAGDLLSFTTHQYTWSSGTSRSYTDVTSFECHDRDFSLDNWGMCMFSQSYIRGKNLLFVFGGNAYTSSYYETRPIYAIDETIYDTSVADNVYALGVIYEDEKLKPVAFQCETSGLYNYITKVIYLDGKTIKLAGSYNYYPTWEQCMAIFSINCAVPPSERSLGDIFIKGAVDTVESASYAYAFRWSTNGSAQFNGLYLVPSGANCELLTLQSVSNNLHPYIKKPNINGTCCVGGLLACGNPI